MLFAIVSMYLIYVDRHSLARISFASAMIALAASLLLSLLELMQSTRSLEIELQDIEKQ
jgi:hypothetical protein